MATNERVFSIPKHNQGEADPSARRRLLLSTWRIRAGSLDRARLSADTRAYDEALAPFLADLARSDTYVARGLASRIEGEEVPGRAARLARGLLDRAGPAEDVRQHLSRIASQPEPKD